MAAQPAPHRAPRAPRRAAPALDARAARIERRRRRRHLQQLRRDLLFDGLAALALMIAIIVVSAGLGVVALLELPAAAIAIGSFVLERRRRRHRGGRRRRRVIDMARYADHIDQNRRSRRQSRPAHR